MYKNFPPKESSLDSTSDIFWSTGAGLWGAEQQVISEPEVLLLLLLC